MSHSHYILEYDDTGTTRGCPPCLAGDLNHDWEWDRFDPDPDRYAVTAAYEYRASHELIDFDYGMDGWLVSERFAQLCRSFGMALRCIPVKVLQSDRQCTHKSYVFMLTSTWRAVRDGNRMENFGIVRAVDLGARHVCTDAFKRACERQRMAGIRFTPVEIFSPALLMP